MSGLEEHIGDRGAASRRSIGLASGAILVAVLLLTSSSFRTPEPMQGPETRSLESWLYDYYYDPATIGYDPTVWGGRVIHGDDLENLIDTDPEHPTLPVFAHVPEELTEERAERIFQTLFPEQSLDEYTERREVNANGTALRFCYIDHHLKRDFDIDRDGRITYRDNGIRTKGDMFGTNESAMEYGIKWLDERHMLEKDEVFKAGVISLNIAQSNPGCTGYAIYISRQVGGLLFEAGPGTNQIRLWIEGGTGRVTFLDYHWPELEMAFMVTDLPSLAFVLEHHGLRDEPDLNLTLWFDEEPVYDEATRIFWMMHSKDAPVYFYLPYWRAGQRHPFVEMGFGWYGAIFPDSNIFYVYSGGPAGPEAQGPSPG